jgi:anti-sigma factor RsiW
MTTCKWAQELFPWFANGTLSAEETAEVAVHLAECEACRRELAGMLRVRGIVDGELRAYPHLPERAWKRVAAESLGQPVAQLDVGSFLVGFSLGASVRRGGVPVYGDLKLLGRKIRVFNVEEEEKT